MWYWFHLACLVGALLDKQLVPSVVIALLVFMSSGCVVILISSCRLMILDNQLVPSVIIALLVFMSSGCDVVLISFGMPGWCFTW
jgi:hypothetical protein